MSSAWRRVEVFREIPLQQGTEVPGEERGSGKDLTLPYIEVRLQPGTYDMVTIGSDPLDESSTPLSETKPWLYSRDLGGAPLEQWRVWAKCGAVRFLS